MNGHQPFVSVEGLRALRAHHAIVIERIDGLLGVLVSSSAAPAAVVARPGLPLEEDPFYVPEKGKEHLPAPRAKSQKRQARKSGAAMDEIGDRVIDALQKAKAPLKGAQICAAAKAEPHVVMPLLRQFVKDGAVVKRGATVSLRYLSPEMAARLSEGDS